MVQGVVLVVISNDLVVGNADIVVKFGVVKDAALTDLLLCKSLGLPMVIFSTIAAIMTIAVPARLFRPEERGIRKSRP